MNAFQVAAFAGVPILICPFIAHEWVSFVMQGRTVILVRDRATLARLMERAE